MTTACRYAQINATRETRSERGAPPQPDAREGQAGPTRVTERPKLDWTARRILSAYACRCGPGRSRQSAPQGRGADGADGTVHLHLGGDLVPRDGPSPA